MECCGGIRVSVLPVAGKELKTLVNVKHMELGNLPSCPVLFPVEMDSSLRDDAVL